MIDNVGYPEIGINGNELVKTPNLDNFASEGTRFERFYSNPLCAPTRASLMTGRYHYRTGVLHTSRGAAKMYGSEITIAELLKNDGYTTGIFGKWHLGDNYPMRPQDQGFDQTLIHKSGRLGQVPDKPNSYINPKLWENGQYIQKDGYCTDIFFDAAMDFMQKHQHTPFFIYLPTNIAHATSEAGQEVPGKYITPYLENGFEENIAAVCGMINNFDENFGRLTAKLSSLGLREKTLVIFLSDDGNVRVNKVDFRGHGYATPYEGSIRVPCFVQWPGHFPGKLKVDQIANHIDILPTLLDAAGADTPDNLTIDGVSLLPLLEGKGKDWADRMIFLQCERGMKVHRYKNCAVISERFKLIAIDLAGYGDNDLPLNPQTFSTTDEVSLVEGILAKETKNNERLHLIGHSYGGAVTLKLAQKILNRVKTMTLFEPVAFHLLTPKGPAHNEITDIVRKLTRALSEGDKIFATQLFIDYWSGKGTFENLSPGNKELFIKKF